MRGRLLIALAFSLVLAPGGAGPALAHQQKIAITTVAHNPRTRAIEIVHQVPVHDAEHAVRLQGAENPDIIASDATREAFAEYVARRFLIAVDGEITIPGYVGSEIVGGNLWVYQEIPAASPEARLRVNSQILTDVWARQENRVNIGGGTAVTTFIVHAGGVPAEAPLKG